MPIFDNELIDNVSDRTPEKRNIDLRSIDIPEVNTNPVVNLGGFESYGQVPAKRGLTVDQISEMSRHAKPFTGFGAAFESVSKAELIDNKRYPMYERGADLENIYGLQQSALAQLGNGFAKLAISATGSFGQSFFTLPDTISALRNMDIAKLSGDMDGGEAKIDDWQKNMEDRFPNFMTRKEKEYGLLSAIPFAPGSANFWGDKIIKNIGFTVGTIGGALVQDAAVAYVTGGLGEIPLIGAQIGKYALAINRFFAGAQKVDKVLDEARALGKTGQQLLRIEKLGQLAATTKLTKSLQYAYSLYGASRTEAAIESRDGFRQVKEELTRQYKERHYGEEPTADDLVEIDNYATNAMNVRFGTNLALLTVSNAIQFDNILRTFNSGSKGVGSSLGKIGLKKGSLDEFEKTTAKTFSGKAWEFARPKLKNVLTEGLVEEGGQYAIERGTYDYYTRKYKNLKNPENKASWDWLNESINSTNQGLAEQFGSEQGIENMLVGGLSALITGGITGRIDKIRKIDEDSKLKSTINILNRWGLTDILENQYDSTLKSMGIAKEMKKALASGDIFEFKNLKQGLFFNMIKSRANNGLHETTIEQLNMLRDLDKAEFEKMFGLNLNKTNKKTVNAYVDAMIEQANDINSTIESIDSTFTNPFKYIVDPKNPEEEKQVENYRTFENWKTDLAYYSTQRKDTNNRLTSIQSEINKINPLITNETLGGLHDATSLAELSTSYEEQANRLNNTITEFTTVADRKRIREEVKALRTNSEKINLALNNNKIDLKTFHTLLNFELNNQDNTKDDVVGFENADQLFTYGADIKLLNQRKKDASDTVDYLSKEEGFDNYFKQEENIANDEVPMDELLVGTAQPTFVNDEKTKERLEVDREYEIRDTKKASAPKKLADDRYQVTAPDGTVTFHKTRTEALEQSKAFTDENTNLSKVKVIAINDDGTVKVEDINGDILNIDPKRLKGYKRIETNQEKLVKNKEDIDREQTELEHNSGTIATSNPEVIDVEEEKKKEGKKLSADELFISSTSESENQEYYGNGQNDPANTSAHVKNSREFLNNAHTFSTRDKLRSILLTPNQVRGLKLDGLVQMSYGKDRSTRVEDIPDAMDVNNGLVLQVFVEQGSDGTYYVDKTGKRIGKVGEPLGDNLKDIIFQTMRTTSLTYKNGSPRYRSEQKAEAEAYSRSWAKYREALFANNDTTFPIFQFSVSRGIAKEKRDDANMRDKNHVGGILIDEDLIANQEGLVVIPTGGTITNSKGEILKWASGIPTLKYGDTLEYLNNRKFNSREVDGIYEVIRQLANGVLEQNKAGQPVTLKGPLSNFLQHVLYWKSKADTYGPNQIGIDINTLSLRLGRNSFPLGEIAANEAAIKQALGVAWNNVNGNTLTKYFSKSFTEFYIDKDGNFASSQWKNYQTYLLSKTYPSGKARPGNDTPLTTGISPKTAETPYVFENKYSTLQGIDLPIEVITPADEAKAEGVATVGEYIVDNKTPNTFYLAKKNPEDEERPVIFKAIEDADGNFNVEVDRNETTATIAKNKDSLQAVINKLKEMNRFDASIPAGEEETYVTDFIAIQISATLKELKKQEAAPKQAPKAEGKKEQPMAPPEVVAQQDIEAKKAEVEKAQRQLDNVESKLNPNANHPKFNVGQKHNVGNNYNTREFIDKRTDTTKDGVEVITKIHKPAVVDENGKIISSAEVEVTFFDSYEQGQEFVNAQYNKYKTIGEENLAKANAELAALGGKSTNQSDIVTVYHHTSVAPKDFNFGNFQRDDKQISQFGDGLNASSTTTPFFVQRYGEPIQGEIKDSEFIVIDANKSEKELYEYLVSKGYKFNGTAKEYDGTEKANNNPAVIILFNDFQKSNPQVKGVKVINHIIGTEKVDPFYVIYNAKSFYGPGSLSKTQTQTPPNQFPSGEFRKAGTNDVDRMSESDFEIFKEWAKENLPLIPWEELEHMITINPNEKAWGVFQNGVAKFVKGGLRGTEYHEIMEAVWAGMLTAEQRQALLDEFKNRKGFFTDRETGNKIAFIEATDQEAKERIMDDFSDFRLGKIPARSLGEYVRRLFNRILNFFKTIGQKPSLKQELFEAINTGKFKEKALAAPVVKEGVQEIFNSNPELANIGTPEQYSQYLDSVFPDSKEKDIFYHGLPFIENKDDFFRDSEDDGSIIRGNEANIRLWNYFFKNRNRASDYGDQQYAVVLDFSADFDSKELAYKSTPAFLTNDSAMIIAQGGDEYVVKLKKQIHILGSKQDVEGFQNFVDNNPLTTYSRVANLTSEQSHSIVQDMLARAGGILFKINDKEMLFNSERLSGREMFNRIEQSYIKDNRRQIIADETWKQLEEKVKTYLKVAGVKFGDEEFEDINSEEANKNDYTVNTFQDTKKSATAALKFSLSTVIERVPTNQEESSLEVPKPKYSNIQLEGFPIANYKLLAFNRVFATLLDKLSNTSDVKLFVKKMLKLAEEDANYVSVFQHLGGVNKTIQFADFKFADWRYFIQFIQTFSRQKPEAYIQYKSIDSVHTGAANLHTAASQTQREWVNNIETLAKGDGTIVRWDNIEKVFTVDKVALKEMKIRKPEQMIAMLNAIGINFDIDTHTKLKQYQKTGKNGFSDQVERIYNHLGNNNELMSISNKTLDINGPLAALAEMYNKVNNPSQESTYFGVEGERIGAFSENNTPSVFKNEFNEADTLADLKQVRTELNDVFSTNSQILKPGGLFYDENGVKRKDLEVSYIQGEKDEDNDKGTTTSKLTIGDRFTVEINQNLKGNYYILIPGDSATEGMMNIGNNVTYDDVRDGKAWKQVSGIFKGYLFDEVNLALDFKNRQELKNINGKEKQLRFFNEILFDNERNEINQMLEDNRSLADITDYINSNISNINSAIKYFIENTIQDTTQQLKDSNKIIPTSDTSSSYLDLDSNFVKEAGLNKNNLSNKSIEDIMTFANINYVIANIEYHKILFGDPYQFAVKEDGSLEAIKRFKSFFSPRRTTFDSPEYNTYLNNNANTVDDIKLDEYKYDAKTNTWAGDLGAHGFKNHTNTITVADNIIAGSLTNLNKVYGKTNETDGVSWLRDTTYREIKLKNGQWDMQGPEEKWFQWEMAFTRQNLPGYKYSNSKLEAHDIALMQTERPAHTIEVLKPIVTGNKLGKNHFDIILDKFSQMPIFYSMVKGTTLEKFYIQMMKQDIGYAIVQSGRKVGTQATHSIYDGEGKFNEQPFAENTIVQVPWKAYGIQVETTTSGTKSQTRGSQITKIASIDLFDNGESIGETQERKDYIKKEFIRNKELLDTMHENAYKELLINLGIEDLGGSFVMKDGKSISETLMNELLRREASENTKDTLALNKENQFIIPFEASPSYSQIRGVIYSMIDKSIGSPSMTGGAHVQAPMTMLEPAAKGRSIVMKNDKGMWEKITREKYATLSDKEKAGVMLTDDSLKFYTKDAPYCEIYLPHWFKDKFKGKFKTDKELFNYLNNTEEGKSILRGVAFRIPTQSLSSTEVFKIKGFLPAYMGATVIVPSEITSKAGSDFDIDKLNMYLKSIYIDANGDVKLIKYKGSEEATKEFYSQVYEDTIKKDIEKIKNSDAFRKDLFDFLDNSSSVSNPIATAIKQQDFYNNNEVLINEIISQADNADMSPADYINKQIQDIAGKEAKLTAKLLNDSLKENFVKDMYKKALENEYYDSLEKLITLPENFDRLISPVDDSGLKDVAKEINGLENKDDNKIKNRLLDRNYMTNQRGNFLRGKRWVGIVAVNITNLSLKQKSQVYIDNSKFNSVPYDDRKHLGDGSIALDHNKTIVDGKERISLSGTKTAVKNSKEVFEYISTRLSGYATGAVDITNNDFITRIVKSDLAMGTFMFLENIGAGEQGIFFLNQPIITEYLKMLDAKNAKSLFYDDNIGKVQDLFLTFENFADDKIDVSLETLKNNISKYSTDKLNDKEKNQQQLILKEFLKYAKMAEFNFEFTQSTNYDTTKFASGDALARKQWATEKANAVNIISSAQNVLDSSHIGLQAKLYSDFMSSMGAVFKLEQDNLRVITEGVLKIYGKNKYLSQDNFNKISNKVKMAFLDYIIQTKTGLNDRIEELLVNPETAVVNRLEKAKEDYPNIQILKELQVVPSPRIGGAKSIQLRVNDKTPESENLNADMMRELRDYNEETKALYDDLISVAILQGGYQSAISFKNIIPIEDYSKIITPVVNSISSGESLRAFSEGFFERNNFDDPNVVPRIKAVKLKIGSEDLVDAPDGSIMVVNTYYANEVFPSIDTLGIKSVDRRILLLTEKFNPKALNSNFIAMPRVLKLKSGERVDMVTGKTITGINYAMRLKKGDLSLSDIFGYKRVYHPGTNMPLKVYDYNGNLQSVYKMVNLYGDGNRASEHYTDFKPSVINNGTIKVDQELNDRDIVPNFPDYYIEDSLSLPTETPEQVAIEEGVQQEEVQQDEFTPEERLELEIADVTRRIAELEQLQEDLDDTNTETIVLNNLPKITPISATKETGAKVGTKLDISPSLLSGNGKSVDQAANDIWDDNFRDTGIDTQDVRNIIIDILSSGSKANYASQLATSGEMARLKEELRDLKTDLSELEKGKPKIKTPKLIPGQLDLFAKEDESWKDEDNDDTCVPF